MTNDPRIRRLAALLVRYCVKAGRRDTVGVSGTSLAEPLMLAVYEELLRAGAFPVLRMAPAGQAHSFVRRAMNHHFSVEPAFERAYARCVDATITILSELDTRTFACLESRKQLLMARAVRKTRRMLVRRPWVLTLFPTPAYARDAGMSLHEFEDFVYGAMFVDRRDPAAAWRSVRDRQQKLISRLRGAREIRITGRGTDLRLDVRGRRFANSAGRTNMPSGEIYAAPLEQSVEGHILFDISARYRGRDVSGIRLEFDRGMVVRASAEKNEKFLRAMIETDKGASRVGEFGIGTNPGIRRLVGNILFDEKMGGTVHLALGDSIPGSGGRNKSAIHWDMIKDLRKGGRIVVDGTIFQKDGVFQPAR